eukprot:RCo017251
MGRMGRLALRGRGLRPGCRVPLPRMKSRVLVFLCCGSFGRAKGEVREWTWTCRSCPAIPGGCSSPCLPPSGGPSREAPSFFKSEKDSADRDSFFDGNDWGRCFCVCADVRDFFVRESRGGIPKAPAALSILHTGLVQCQSLRAAEALLIFSCCSVLGCQ